MVRHRRRRALSVSIIPVVASSVGVHRDFNGSYTLVNQANGRRISSSAGGFFAIKQGPIADEHKWTLVPQGNLSYAIVNAKNGMRIVAQSGMAWEPERGFFAIDHGPIFEDQKWRLNLQEDGSYSIINLRSSRRILARSDGDGGKGFAAVRSDGPVREDERWWLINQDRDEAGRFFMQLEKLGREFKAKVGESLSLAGQLKSARSSCKQELAGLQGEVARLTDKALVERRVRVKLAEAVEAKQHETDLVIAQIQNQKDANVRLAEDYETARALVSKLDTQLQVEKSAKEVLEEEAEARRGVFGCLWSLQTDAPVSHSVQISLLALAVVGASFFLPYFRHRLQSAHGRASQLAAEVEALRAAAGKLSDENAEKQARLHEMEQKCLECPTPAADSDGELGFDFACKVFNMDLDQATMRLIKVQCPGVCHEDIEVRLVFNGCEVHIHRKASRGVEATTWRKQFCWNPSEGLFEFKEDQMQLEHGFLHLVFKAYTFQSRVIRFPQHFNLDCTDMDMCWDYSAEEASPLDESPQDLAPMKPSSSYLDTESTASTPRKRVCADD